MPVLAFKRFLQCFQKRWNKSGYQEISSQSSKSTRAFQFSLKASENTDDPCIVLKKMSRIWLAMFSKLWQKPIYAPCKPAQDLSNVFVRTYLWFWPAFIWRFFLAKKNSAGCLLKNKVANEKTEYCNLTRRFWQHMNLITNLTQYSTWSSIRISTYKLKSLLRWEHFVYF